MLPGAAFTDPAVLEWELATSSAAAGSAPATSTRSASAATSYDRDRRRERARRRRRRRSPARLPEHLPPSRRAARRPSRRDGCAGCSARTTRGPTASTGAARTRRSPTAWRTSTRPASALHQVRLAVVEGLVLLDLSGEAPPPQDAHRRPRAASRRATGSASCAARARIVYDVDANWKAIAENYSECLHCPGVHPELNRLSHYLSGEDDQRRRRLVRRLDDARRGRRDDGAPTGGHGRPPIAGVDDLRSILYFLLFPNTLVSLHPDYVMLHTLWPRRRTAPRSCASGSSSRETIAARRLRPVRRRRASGTRSTARTGTSAGSRSAGMALARVHARPLHDAGGRRARRST